MCGVLQLSLTLCSAAALDDSFAPAAAATAVRATARRC
jgi:hypothetical protein